MNEFINKYNFIKTFLILFLCLSFVFSVTLYSTMKAQASEISEKVQKDRVVPVIVIMAGFVIGAAAFEGVKYWGIHSLFGSDWTKEGQINAIIAGTAAMALTLYSAAHGNVFVMETYALSEAGIEAFLNGEFDPIIRSVFEGISKFDAGSISYIIENLKTVQGSIEEILLRENEKISINSGMVIDELNFDEMWLDFRNPEIITSNINFVTSDMQYNDYYGGSWLMHYKGTSELYGSFLVEELPERVMLKLIHLTSKLEGAFQDGYSPIDIYINGQLFLDDYDVAESYNGSHSFESDSWDISNYLVVGGNSVNIKLVNIPDACSNYWIQALEILPESIPSSSARLNITPSGSDPSTTIRSTWSVSGNVKDANGDNVSGASINVFLEGYSQSWGSGTTDSNGNYSISNISAPAKGSYTITIEASAAGTTGTNSSQTLTVTDPREGHDLSLECLNVNKLSIEPGEAVSLETGVTNSGNYSENFNLIFELKYPNGNICDSSSIPLSLNSGVSTGLKSRILFSGSTTGTYTALVRIDAPYDCNPADNQLSIPIYVGPIPDYDYYNLYMDFARIGDPPVNHDGYSIELIAVYGDGRATYTIDGSVTVTLAIDEFYDGYDGGKLIIRHGYGNSDSIPRNAFWKTWTVNLNQKTITPDRLQVSQGQQDAYYIIQTPGNEPYNIGPEEVTSDGEYIADNWDDSWSRKTIDSTHYKALIDIPTNAPIKTYNFWLGYMHSGTGDLFAQKVQLTVNPAHDAFVNSISTKVDGVEKTEFDIGEDVTITANVGVSGGYTEEVNVVLSITGPNGYYYPDSKDRIASKATISSTSQDIAFDPWNTSGLMPGNYTISVTANMGADINSGNNTKAKAVVIKELPALIVDGQTDKTTYDQGEQIELTATVTDPNTNPVNDATVTATITWPDLTESNPALSYNAGSGKYEYNFNATQFGSYTIELRAVKINYGTGNKELPAVTVNNTPPDTVINNVVPSEGQTINSSSVIFSWTGSDSGTPVHHLAYSWKLDEGSYSVFSTNTIIELNELSDGPHTFYVKAFDGQLEDLTPAQRSFIVDTSEPPEPPEVYLSKTSNKTTVTSGEVVTYTIAYDNDGAGPAKNAVIEDVIPANTTYVAASASSGNVIHTGNVVVEIKVNSVWEPDSTSPSGEVTTVRWTFDSDIAVDDGDNYGTAEDESPNTNDTDAGTVTLQVTIE